jgi:diaminopimelate epimerase
MRFEKWEGLGNDFILVESDVSAQAAPLWCDRRRGVGGDGVLVLADLGLRRARMHVLNADGSRPEMCGNGLRCVAAWLAERQDLTDGEVVVETDAGERRCELGREASGRWQVIAEMGRARVGDSFTYPPQGLARRFVHVDVGNPHAVSFDPFDDDDVDLLGAAVERHVQGGVNVEFCRVAADAAIDVVVWERGVGRTQACGTGACAVVAAAASLGEAPYDQPVAVRLPGGVLRVTVSDESRRLLLEGPARRCFVGQVAL